MNCEKKNNLEFFKSRKLTKVPFSEAVRVGNLLFVSGQIGLDVENKIVTGGISEETLQTMENIRTILERHGTSLNQVVKITVMMADMNEWSAMNRVYKNFFSTDLPARSAFGSSGLAMGARVEIECIAMIDEG